MGNVKMALGSLSAGLMILTIFSVMLSIAPGFVMADPVEEVPDPIGFDGNFTDWVEDESDEPTGDSYLLFENHGGWWADAEKSPTDDEDDLLCWAATDSNMLEWTGWGFVGGMDGTDDFFEYYQDHVNDKGSNIEFGLEWWFDGNLPAVDDRWADETVEGGNFWSSDYNWYEYVSAISLPSLSMFYIEYALLHGITVGLGIRGVDGNGAHAITCWGYNYDPDADLPEEYDTYFQGVWVTDSDSHKNQADPDEVLSYFALEYSSENMFWWMPNYGSGWYIDAVAFLKVFPDDLRPVANAGPMYYGYEGSPVMFNGGDSQDPDDDDLTYRWDFDGDAAWDTSWTSNEYTSHTWYDDYEGTVYMEAFDARLRDVDITGVSIDNVAPTVSASGGTINENGVATVTGTISDPGTLDTFKLEINWGEGATQSHDYPAGTKTFSLTHQYLDDNPTATSYDIYNVSIKVTDDDGGVGSTLTTVRINDVAAVVNTLTMDQPNPQFILPLVHELDFEATFSDVGTKDTHKATWDWDDGTTDTGTLTETDGSGTVTGSHVFSEPGTYVVEISVKDDDTLIGTKTITVVVVDADEAIEDMNDYIQGLDDSCFKNNADERKNALDQKTSATLKMLENEAYKGVIQKLIEDFRDHADGSVDGKENNDWITDEEAQEHICMKIDDIVAYLKYFL